MTVVQGGKPSKQALIGFAVIVVILCGISARALTASTPSAPSTAASNPSSSNSSGQPQAVATLTNPSDNTVATLSMPSGNSSKSTQPQTLLNLSGQGTKQTQKFTTSSDWTLTYSYDCSNFGTQGNFMVDIYNDDGSLDANDTSVNQLGMNGSDTEYYYDAGTYYLSVNSECSWRITVKG